MGDLMQIAYIDSNHAERLGDGDEWGKEKNNSQKTTRKREREGEGKRIGKESEREKTNPQHTYRQENLQVTHTPRHARKSNTQTRPQHPNAKPEFQIPHRSATEIQAYRRPPTSRIQHSASAEEAECQQHRNAFIFTFVLHMRVYVRVQV